jgi:glycosyltransferase involved in cell wall biosynthesis
VPTFADELCHVNLAPGFRGGERQTELLIRALLDKVPRQRLVARAGGRLAERLGDLPNVKVTGVGGRIGAIRATASAGLVHAHETHGAQVAAVRKALSGTPFLVTRRVVSRPTSSPFTRFMYRSADRVVALSAAVERVMAEFDAGIPCLRIPSAASGLSFDSAWVERYRAERAGKFIVGHVGAYDFAQKGQDVLLEAAALLRHLRPEIEFVLVGSGPDEARLKTRAAGMTNVTVAGWADNVGDYLAAFDAFVFPSIHEGLGSILLDAMEFGLPIVASNVDGIPDIVADGRNGLLVPPRQAAAVADAIARLHADPNLREAMAAANRARAREYSAAAMAAKYLNVYAELDPRLGLAKPG